MPHSNPRRFYQPPNLPATAEPGGRFLDQLRDACRVKRLAYRSAQLRYHLIAI